MRDLALGGGYGGTRGLLVETVGRALEFEMAPMVDSRCQCFLSKLHALINRSVCYIAISMKASFNCIYALDTEI